jgi:hypothetical protein
MPNWVVLSIVALEVLEETLGTTSASKICCTFQHYQHIDFVDQELLEASRQHMLCFLIVMHSVLGIKSWSLNLLCTLLSIPPIFYSYTDFD